jgi:uncharacterized membrane protein
MTDMPGSTHPVATARGGSGLPENVAGALSYVLGALTGIAFFVIDRDRPFVRFHAVQSIGVTIAWVAITVALMIVSTVIGVVPVLGFLVSILLNLGLAVLGFILWIVLMLQAYRGKTWEVPGLGPHVRRLAAETGGGTPS